MQLRTGQIVAVEFVDHVEDGSQAMAFVVYGRVARVTRAAICIDSWCYANRKTKHDQNCKRYTLVRAAIKRVQQLRPVD